MNIKNLICAGTLGIGILTTGCGQIDEIPQGTFSLTGPSGAECEIESTTDGFFVENECLELLNPIDSDVVVESSLPQVTDRASVEDVKLWTKVRVESDPNQDVDVFVGIGVIWIYTKENLIVRIEMKNQLLDTDERRYESTDNPIIFEGLLTGKTIVTIEEAVIIE